MLIEKDLPNPPPDVAATIEADAERVDRLLAGRKMRLSDEKAERIEKDLSSKYDSWHNQTTTLRRRLVRYNDLLEGVVPDTNFPFDGASNITTHYAAGISRTFRSTFNKTVYQDDQMAVPILDPSYNMDATQYKLLQDGFNHTFATLYNGVETLKNLTVPTLRDGTGVVMGSWERRVQKAFDTRRYENYAAFQKDYPTADAAGISEDEYRDLADQFILEPGSQLEIEYAYDFVEFDGIEYSVASFANFVFYPTFATKIKRMELYGSLYKLSQSEIKAKVKRKEFYERGATKVLNKSSGAMDTDSWDRSRTAIEGINQGTEDYKPVLVGDFVYTSDQDNDGIPEKYLLTYAVEAKALLSIQRYPIRHNIDVAVEFRMIKRENRFPGVSLIGDCEDLFNQIDVLHRHRNNVRMLCTSPILLAKADLKDVIDLGRSDMVVHPGVTFWVPDINASVKQLDIKNLDQPGNEMDEESMLTRYVELVFGPTQGLSGGQTPDDPRAPAHKTEMLMIRADQRIDDYIDEFCLSMPAMFSLHAALLYQYYPKPELKYEKDNKTLSFPLKELVNPNIRWGVKRRSVTLTPEFAMNRMATLMGIYVQLKPLIDAGDKFAIEMWNRQVVNSGEPEAQKLIITPEQAQQLAMAAQQNAQTAMEKQSDAKAKQKGKANFQGQIGKILGEAAGKALTGQTDAEKAKPGQPNVNAKPESAMNGAQK